MELRTDYNNLKNANRAAISEMVAAYMEQIDNGTIDPVETFIFAHKLLEFATLLHSNVKPHVAGVRGDFYGLRISEAKTGSTYDYGVCNSPRWQYLVDEMARIKELMEKEQTFLKSLPAPIEVVDDDTGEVFQIRPPSNSFSISPKVEWL